KAWTSSTIAGGAWNEAMGYSVISGGSMNKATGWYTSIGGGTSNMITTNSMYSNISGGRMNWIDGDDSSIAGGYMNKAWTSATIAGGAWNQAMGWYSSVLGGSNNTAAANYSTILGGNWLELNGDRSIGFNATSMPYMVSQSNVAVFLGVNMGIGTTAPSAALEVMGYVKAWGFESSDAGFVLSGSVLRSISSTAYGLASDTHVNWGFLSETGMNTNTTVFAVVGGGELNMAKGHYNTISGGKSNVSSGAYASIGGGESNHSNDFSVVSGGKSNMATGWYTSIAGGMSNSITTNSMYSNISGGQMNWIDGDDASIGGGYMNKAWTSSTIAGGAWNEAKAYGVVSGGTMNMATGLFSTIGGGHSNIIEMGAWYNTISGGQMNWSTGVHTSIGGGYMNQAHATGTVAGGSSNIATGWYTTIGGGIANSHTTNSWYSTISGGRMNWTSDMDTSIGGGYMNKAWTSSTISGGTWNEAQHYSAVSGGQMNVSSGWYSSIGGGHSNLITTGAWGNTISGGQMNWSTGMYSSIGGGYMNQAHATGTVSGGAYNQALAPYSSVAGGAFNTAAGAYSASAGGAYMAILGQGTFGYNGSGMSATTTIGLTNAAVFMVDKFGIGTTTPDHALQISMGSICAGSNAFCTTKANSIGVIYASTTVYDGADYAEYFEAESDIEAGSVVGLNPDNGLVRKYQSGDQLLGIVSTKPGVLGNASATGGYMVAVALVGQVPINKSEMLSRNRQAYTMDGKRIGYLLKNGNYYISQATNESNLDEVKSLKKQVDDMKQLLKTQMYLMQSMKKQINFILQNQR
ncbi:hypothetical protein MJH12_12645, partial [bacterium]|nr:hypothetical protein [bacterium]